METWSTTGPRRFSCTSIRSQTPMGYRSLLFLDPSCLRRCVCPFPYQVITHRQDTACPALTDTARAEWQAPLTAALSHLLTTPSRALLGAVQPPADTVFFAHCPQAVPEDLMQTDRSLDSNVDDIDMSAIPLRELESRFSPQDDPIILTTGWDRSLSFSLFLCIVATLWGTALVIFSTGVVFVHWNVSLWGQAHPNLINVIVTVIATLSTAQLKLVIQQVASHLAEVLVVSGFTLRSLSWIQGIKEWRLWTHLPKRWLPVWLLVYVAMALHSASVVAIMQPVVFVRHVFFGDIVPCGVPPGALTLNPPSSLSSQELATLDHSAYTVGLQLGGYRELVAWNITTVAFGRPYVKENVSFAAVGGLINGLQNVSGVLFDVQCADDPKDDVAVSRVWSRTFPLVPFPTPNITHRSDADDDDLSLLSGSFPDPIINTSLTQAIASSRTFNLTVNDMALYGLVNANGSGALIGVTTQGTVACSWLAIPKHVEVITVNWISRSVTAQSASMFPQYVGRGVLATLEGMAEAIRSGSRIDVPRASLTYINKNPHPDLPTTARMLAVLLSDGVRSALTGFTSMLEHGMHPEFRRCPSNNRTIASHWRFGNAHQLGWIAIILTPACGVAGFVILQRVSLKTRVKDAEPLDVADAFQLGFRSDLPSADQGSLLDAPLRLEGDRIVVISSK